MRAAAMSIVVVVALYWIYLTATGLRSACLAAASAIGG